MPQEPQPTPQKNRIKIESIDHLRNELHAILQTFKIKESEQTWESFQKALFRLEGLTRGGAYKFDPLFLETFDKLREALVNSILTQRTRLSGTAVECLETISARLGLKFEPYIHIYVNALLTLCSRTNKVFVTRALKCLCTIIKYTKSGEIISRILDKVRDKSQDLRAIVAQLLLYALEHVYDQQIQARLPIIEDSVSISLHDPSLTVRQAYRQVFKVLSERYPTSAAKIMASLSPKSQKNVSAVLTQKAISTTVDSASVRRPLAEASINIPRKVDEANAKSPKKQKDFPKKPDQQHTETRTKFETHTVTLLPPSSSTSHLAAPSRQPVKLTSMTKTSSISNPAKRLKVIPVRETRQIKSTGNSDSVSALAPSHSYSSSAKRVATTRPVVSKLKAPDMTSSSSVTNAKATVNSISSSRSTSLKQPKKQQQIQPKKPSWRS